MWSYKDIRPEGAPIKGFVPGCPNLPDNVLDILTDAMEDPDYDPNNGEDYKGLWRWPDGRVASAEEIEYERRRRERVASLAGRSMTVNEIKARYNSTFVRPEFSNMIKIEDTI